ncbi:MAG: 2-amino-4-oxopentanoate thiolase subunit OrtA [Caldisericia bacterium]|nr:2-amino-4-oxopentanoate thiolase subunit OrtA [Caldisericia bacterium]
MILKKGDYVEIKKTLLNPDERAENLPDDTKKVPYEGKIRGYLTHDGEIGKEVEIETPIGRKLKGILLGLTKEYTHNFGEPIRELIDIGKKIKEKYLKD